jgi:hypothetical protein
MTNQQKGHQLNVNAMENLVDQLEYADRVLQNKQSYRNSTPMIVEK